MSQRILCLQIWDGRLAAVQIDKSWSGMSLRDWLLLDLPLEPENAEEVAGYAAAGIRDAGLSGYKVLLALGGSRAYLRRMEFPFSARDKIEKALPFEMEASLPLPREELIFDYYYQGKGSAGGCKVLAAALPRREVRKWIHALREQGLDPARIDLHTSSLLRLAVQGERQEKCVAVWELGRRESAVAVLRQGRLLQVRCFRMGTEDLTSLLAEETGEQMLLQDLFWGNEVPDGMASRERGEALNKFLRAAQKELLRSVWAAQNEFPETVVDSVLLTGSGACLKGLPSALQRQTGLSFSLLSDSDLAELDISAVEKEKISELATTALLSLVKDKRDASLDFRRGELAYQGGRSWRKSAIHGGVGLTIVLALALSSFSYHVWLKQQELQGVRDRVEEVFREAAPEASRTLQPAQYESVLQNRISSSREIIERDQRACSGASLLELFLFLSWSIPEEEGFRLDRMTMQNREALLVGNAGSYDSVDLIRGQMLSQQGVAEVRIQEVSANPGQDTVRFTLRVEIGE